MKLSLKYGFLVAIAIAAWVGLKHFALHLEPRSAQFADLAVFNLAAIVGLAAGMREKRVLNGGTLSFSDGWITGSRIAVTYAILITAYFAILIALVGRTLLQQEGEASLTKAFAGILIGCVVFGTAFSAIIALVLRKR